MLDKNYIFLWNQIIPFINFNLFSTMTIIPMHKGLESDQFIPLGPLCET